MVALTPLLLATKLAAVVLAFGPPGESPMIDPERVLRADSLFQAGAPREAFREVDALLDEDPQNYEALWRAASFAVALGVVAEETRNGDAPHEWYERAERLATRGRVVEPERVEARYWEVATLGRRALGAGPQEASELADRIRTGALEILDREPEHPGAHNALGRLYYEIMALPGVSRFLGRTFTRTQALDEASWSLAESHLRRAVELDPGMPLYRLDFARYLLRRGDRGQAREELERVVHQAGGQPPEAAFAAEARRLLREADG
jgi:tetratricopeptide (TPR) repeat protein